MRAKSITEKNIAPRIVCTASWRLKKVKALPNYQLEVEFVDGISGLVDLAHRVTSNNAGIFATLKDVNLFQQVYLEHGAVTWPNEIDLAPDAMYDEIKKYGKWILK